MRKLLFLLSLVASCSLSSGVKTNSVSKVVSCPTNGAITTYSKYEELKTFADLEKTVITNSLSTKYVPCSGSVQYKLSKCSPERMYVEKDEGMAKQILLYQSNVLVYAAEMSITSCSWGNAFECKTPEVLDIRCR
jgi:hypothetical protein